MDSTIKLFSLKMTGRFLLHSLENFNAVVLLPSEFKAYDETPNISWVPLEDKSNYYPIGIARRKDMIVTDTYQQFIEAIKNN